ncbi:MAG TPA: hypothetical protein VGD91_09130, partial [Trebonia sp.]
MSCPDHSLVSSLSHAEKEAREAADDRALAAARDSLPARRIIEVFGGFLAVPAGSVIAQSTTLDG